MAEEKDRYNLEEIKERLDGAGLPQLGLPNLIGGDILPDEACEQGCYTQCYTCNPGGSAPAL